MQRKRSWFGQFWYIFGPLLIRELVSLVVTQAAVMVLLLKDFAGYMAVLQSQETNALMNYIAKQTAILTEHSAELSIITSLCTIPIVLIWFLKDRKKKGAQHPAGLSPVFYAAIIPFVAALCVGLNNLLILSSSLYVDSTYQAVAQEQYSVSLVVQIIGYVIFAPVCEELIFRGMLYRRLRETMSYRASLLLSAFVFGMYHGNVVQFLYAGLLGVVFAFLYEKYGSVKAPVFAHMILNLTSILLTETGMLDWIFTDVIKIGVITVIAAAVASSMFVVIARVEKKTV